MYLLPIDQERGYGIIRDEKLTLEIKNLLYVPFGSFNF